MSDERAVQEVLARYARATDKRDGVAQGGLFTDDAVVRILAGGKPATEPMIGSAGVRYAVENFMAPHPEGGASHHVTSDHIIEVDGDRAHLDAQFVVFEVRPDVVRLAESGYYDTDLARIDGGWKIVRHDVLLDSPIDLTAAAS